MFAVFAALGVPRLLSSGPEIRVDVDGIWWRRWSDVTLPWSAITAIEERSMHRNRFLCLHLADPGVYRSTRAIGRLAAANRGLGFGDVAIATVGTDATFDDLLAAVERFAPVPSRPLCVSSEVERP